MSILFQTVQLDVKKIDGKQSISPHEILDVGTKFTITTIHGLVPSPASLAMLRWPHACPCPPLCPLSPTAWHRSSGPAAGPALCTGAAWLSCSSIPVGTSPSQDILTPRTSSSSWQIPQCPDPDYRIHPWMKVPKIFWRILL